MHSTDSAFDSPSDGWIKAGNRKFLGNRILICFREILSQRPPVPDAEQRDQNPCQQHGHGRSIEQTGRAELVSQQRSYQQRAAESGKASTAPTRGGPPIPPSLPTPNAHPTPVERIGAG